MARPGRPVAGYGPYAEVYDAVVESWFRDRILRLVLRLIRREGLAVRRVLDLACGTGVAVVRLARLGYEVTGVDLSEPMLRRARARALEAGVLARFLRQDMRTFRAPRPVDLVVCLYDSLNHLPGEGDLVAAFRAVRRALRPGGCFVFDANTVYGLAHRWGTATTIEHDGPDLFVVHDTVYDAAREANTLTVHGFIRRGERFERFTDVTRERGYRPARLRTLLRQAGFEVRGLYNPKLGPPTARTGWVIGIARRPPERT